MEIILWLGEKPEETLQNASYDGGDFIVISGGTSSSGNGGSVLIGGSSTGGAGGAVNIVGGNGFPSIYIPDLPEPQVFHIVIWIAVAPEEPSAYGIMKSYVQSKFEEFTKAGLIAP